MDPISALSVASAVLTMVDVGARIAKRLEELHEAGDAPHVFRSVRTRLPLILSIVTRVADSEDSLPPDAREGFRMVVSNCYEHVNRLDEIVQKVTVKPGDNKIKKGLKAAVSLVEESRVERIASALQHDLELLTLINVAPAEENQEKKVRRGSEALPAYFTPTSIFMVPFVRDEQFIGREKILDDVKAKFQEQSRVAIAGPGGVGKSQIAIEYAYRFQQAHPSAYVFWVYGGSVSRFYQAYRRIAQRLELPNWDDPDTSIFELVSDWFNSTSTPYLLILDNADDISLYWPGKYKSTKTKDADTTDLSLYIPSGEQNISVLITSRDARVASRLMKGGAPIPVQAMNKEEAKKLFTSQIQGDYCKLEEKSIEEIVTALDCLPLAVSQAAAFIDENCISPTEYLEALKSDEAEEFLEEELNDSRRDEGSVNSTFRAWLVSFDQISKQNTKAADLLSLLAMFDRQSIPRSLIKVPGLILSIGVLQNLHMISTRPGTGSLQLHRLTQRFTQLWLKRAGKLQHYQEAALASISSNYPTEIGVGEWETCELLAPHVQVVTSYEYESKKARLDLANLLCWSADFDVERGMYQQALHGAKRSRDMFLTLTEPNDQKLAAATWLYGRLEYYEAKSEADVRKAEKILLRAFEISDRLSLHYAETAFELAHLYFDLGHEKECLKMGKASYESWEGMETRGSNRTLDNQHDYSLELAMLGRVEEAVAGWQEIINLTPKSDAAENTKTVYSYRSMACIAEFQGDASTAEILYSKLVKLCTAMYNPEHVHVFDYRLSHAEALMRQGKYEEAVEKSLDILDICQNKSEWRIKANCLETLAECYRLTGKYDEEEEPRMKCLGLYEENLDGDNEGMANRREAAARCLMSNLHYSRAQPLLERALQWRESQRGSQHAETIDTLELLAICKGSQGRLAEAESMFLRALTDTEGTDPRILNNVCCSLWNLQKWSELELRCKEALGLDSRYHPQANWMLIKALEEQGKTTEAVLLRAESVKLEDVESDLVDLTRQPMEPPFRLHEKPRFGSLLHPKVWSS